jgi:biotin carboxyl carrier protein
MKRLFLLMAACLVSAWSLIISVGIISGESNENLKNKSVFTDHSPSIEVKEPCRIKLIKKVVLASERPGTIGFVTPQEGDIVSKDALIISLRSEIPEAALGSAKVKAENDVDLEFAKSQRDVSQAEYDLTFKAKKRRSTAVGELELITAELKLIRSTLQIKQAEKQTEIDEYTRQEAEANLKSFQVKAPWKGVVTKLHKKFRGEAVSQGEPILEMANTDYVHIEAEVPLKDALRVKQGDLAKVHLNIPEIDLAIEEITEKGRVVFVDVTVIRGSVEKVLVKVKVKNPKNIFREGLYASMILYPESKGPIFEDEKPESTEESVTHKQ